MGFRCKAFSTGSSSTIAPMKRTRREFVQVFGSLAFLGLTGIFCPGPASAFDLEWEDLDDSELFQGLEDFVEPRRNPGSIFLTFDDGPKACTAMILDRLSQASQKGAFFLIGAQLRDKGLRKLAIRALEEGHDLGNHSHSHRPFSDLTQQDMESEIVNAHREIVKVYKEAGAEYEPKTRFFRFPYGDAGDFKQSVKVLNRLGYRIAWWDVDPKDWRMNRGNMSQISAKVMETFRSARPDDVVILHDRVPTAALLPDILAFMKNRGLSSKRLSLYDVTVKEPKRDSGEAITQGEGRGIKKDNNDFPATNFDLTKVYGI